MPTVAAVRAGKQGMSESTLAGSGLTARTPEHYRAALVGDGGAPCSAARISP